MTALERYLPLLLDGDTDASMADLTPDVEIHDAMIGTIIVPVTYSFIAARHVWMTMFKSRLDHVLTTRAGNRAIAEYVLHLEVEGRPAEVPVAIVGDETEDGKLVRVRTYHSMFPIKGRSLFRGRLLQSDEMCRPPPPVDQYLAALGAGDVERILELFAPDATVREPSGGIYTHRGPEGRRGFYSTLLAHGGIPLEPCTMIDDGHACAVEYNVVRWGTKVLAPQAGVAVYQRATPTQLGAVRIYDDVDPLADGAGW